MTYHNNAEHTSQKSNVTGIVANQFRQKITISGCHCNSVLCSSNHSTADITKAMHYQHHLLHNR